MAWKILNIIILCVIMVISTIYIRSSILIGVGTTNNLGAGFYPLLLAILLILLCIIKMAQIFTERNEDSRIDMGNWKLIVFTIITISLFIYSWSTIGYFYINLFFFVLVLYMVYTKQIKRKGILRAIIFPITVTLGVFTIFNLILSLQL